LISVAKLHHFREIPNILKENFQNNSKKVTFVLISINPTPFFDIFIRFLCFS